MIINQLIYVLSDPQRIVTASAPTYVRRGIKTKKKLPPVGVTPDSFVLTQGLDENYAQIVKKFSFQHVSITRLELVSARGKTLDIKSYTEYFGAMKYFDNSILKRQYQLKSDESLLEWKSIYNPAITGFDEGRIDGEYVYHSARQIQEEDRVLNVPLRDIDPVILPKMQLGWEVKVDNGKYAFCRSPTYYL